MKKYLLILLILLCGCSKKENIVSVFENEKNILISINYPETNITKLDRQIEDYINEIYENFKEEYGNIYSLERASELNIDYKYEIIDERYINIILYNFIDSPKLAHPINEIKTFVYDNKTNKILNLKDVININDIIPILKTKILNKYKDCVLLDLLETTIIPKYNNFPFFTFDNEKITFYFNPYTITSGSCNVISIDIPLNKIKLKINIKDYIKPTYNFVNDINTKEIDPNKKVVAITFDDGPSKYTKEINDLLKQYNSNATFFVLGNKVKIYSNTINESIKQGNEIGNHSYNHKWLSNLTIEELKYQINETNNLIKEISGYEATLLRPTYGSINKKIRQNTDMNIVMWTVDSNDWKIKNSQTIANKVLNKVKDEDIILFHDTYERTYKALQIIIPKLIEEDYQLVTISELEEVKLIRKNN